MILSASALLFPALLEGTAAVDHILCGCLLIARFPRHPLAYLICRTEFGSLSHVSIRSQVAEHFPCLEAQVKGLPHSFKLGGLGSGGSPHGLCTAVHAMRSLLTASTAASTPVTSHQLYMQSLFSLPLQTSCRSAAWPPSPTAASPPPASWTRRHPPATQPATHLTLPACPACTPPPWPRLTQRCQQGRCPWLCSLSFSKRCTCRGH